MDKLRYSAIGCALPVLFYGLISATDELQNPLFAKGVIQSGHSELACASCHVKNPGTYRQQIQANVHFQLGMRSTPVDFGYAKVGSAQCLSCHERPNERHPIYRFQEPRFEKATQRVEATSCLGCHSEHVDRRVNADTAFCAACHEDLRLKADPLDVSHVEIIARNDWESCLGCHDFHGNHVHDAPKSFEARYQPAAVREYLAAGVSPYGTQLYYKAKDQ